jgi:hypothetical protein
MKKIVKLKESHLESIIHQVLKEQTNSGNDHPLCPVQCKIKVLGKGNVGVDVKMVQSALSKCGFNKEKEGGGMIAGCGKDFKKCDGKFDIETQKAVREFQKDRGITMDGLVGPKTLAQLTKGLADACLAPFKCNCKKNKPVDNKNSGEGVVPGKGDMLSPEDTVSISCKKSTDCFKKFNKPSGVDACGLAKCLGICLPKGMCKGVKVDVSCGECPKSVNEMPGVGRKKRTKFTQNCIDIGCTKVVV